MSDEGDGGALTKLEQAIDWAYKRGIEGMPGVSGAEPLASEFLRSHPVWLAQGGAGRPAHSNALGLYSRMVEKIT